MSLEPKREELVKEMDAVYKRWVDVGAPVAAIALTKTEGMRTAAGIVGQA